MISHFKEFDKDIIVPLPLASSFVLKRVIEWLDHHKDDDLSPIDEDQANHKIIHIDDWDKKFLNANYKTAIFQILAVANYMNIRHLLDLCCKTVANMMKGKSAEEMREMFGIVNDFTPEEETQIKKENEWAMKR